MQAPDNGHAESPRNLPAPSHFPERESRSAPRARRRLYRGPEGSAKRHSRFRSVGRFDSVQWEDTSGWRLDETRGRLRLCGIGEIKARLHRPLRGTPKAITVSRQGRRWWVSLRCVEVPAEPLPG